MIKALFVRAEWDDEANFWVATSDDVPGFATEADTLEQLSQKLDVMIPELLEANDCSIATPRECGTEASRA